VDRPALALRIRFYLRRSGVSRRELALALGITEQCVWSWIHAKAIPSVPTLARFCTVCGTDLATFFGPVPRSYRIRRRPVEPEKTATG